MSDRIQAFAHGERVDIRLAGLPPAPPLRELPAEEPRFSEGDPPDEHEPSAAETWKPGKPCPFCEGVVLESKTERGRWTCSTDGCPWSYFGLKGFR